jgi:hypothetical protein
MHNRLQREWTAADRDTFDKWAIGVIIFYGSLALLVAALVLLSVLAGAPDLSDIGQLVGP